MPTIATITPTEGGWLVRVPTGAEAVVDDIRYAAFDAAKLIDPDRWFEITRDLVFVDASGTQVHAFTLFFDWSNDEADLGAIAEDLPQGCRWYPEGPGLHCLRPGATRFDAIATLAAEIRGKFGITVDFGYEKDEWDNEPDRIAHLLLNAVNRAGSSGVDEHQLLRFVTQALGGTVTSATTDAGEKFTSCRLPDR
ncbi:hypothetical protein [Nocardia rhizosphaerae]|uniref:Barstar (Barnase inhibitor) n=1 Tax=Nocardia rhizosphaerae TaxID=1691571 RepID=A0ABV8L8T9_9NOCA